ncbi:hypothetical protein TURU_095444 [Turdus rufiventris]|nr:hypothetical protein TURU_095444 [Turdus rufiventris]
MAALGGGGVIVSGIVQEMIGHDNQSEAGFNDLGGHEKNELAEVILGPAGIKHILESDRNTSSEIHDNC